MPKYVLFFLLYFGALPCFSQDDLLDLLNENDSSQTYQQVSSTFKGTRLINGHTVELRSNKVMDLIISHRFGRINSGFYEFFGLDEANVRIGLDYGVADRLNVGIGRNSFQKTYDGFIKYQFLRQSSGQRRIPVTAVLFSSAAMNTLRQKDDFPFSSKFSYTWQLLIGKKLNSRLSLQVAPTMVHHNLIKEARQTNDKFAIGIGGRYKLTNRVSINTEYYYRINPVHEFNHFNSLSVGFDIETGGHVFQLHFSNSRAMIEKGFITETTGDFFKGDIHFGFNISRVFQF
jgi:hypothetical protein